MVTTIQRLRKETCLSNWILQGLSDRTCTLKLLLNCEAKIDSNKLNNIDKLKRDLKMAPAAVQEQTLAATGTPLKSPGPRTTGLRSGGGLRTSGPKTAGGNYIFLIIYQF